MKHIFDDQDKNKYEAYSKEETLELLQEVIASGELPEELNGLVITLKNPIDNLGYKIAFCTQAKYNELEAGGQLESNCYYYITDDTSWDDFVDEVNQIIAGMRTEIDALPKFQELMQEEASEVNLGDGTQVVHLNAMENQNNYIEITGYIKTGLTGSQGKEYVYFSHKLKIKKQGEGQYVTRLAQEIYFPDRFSTNNILVLEMVAIWGDYSDAPQINYVMTNAATGDTTCSGYDIAYKILSVKELINY